MWILLALGASVFWGLTYVLNEEVYKSISVTTLLAIASFIIFIVTLLVSLFTDNLRPDLASILASRRLLIFVILGVTTLLVAELFIGYSIVAKNATLAGLIEISYPIFIALASYFIFKNDQLTWSAGLGGALIFTGIAIIYYFNK